MRIMPFALPRSSLLLAALLVFSPSWLCAQAQGQVGERAQGMAGAFVAVADDASAIYWNPAGLATGGIFDAQFSVSTPSGTTEIPDPMSSSFVGVAMPPLGLAYYRVGSAVVDPDDRQNGGSGEVRVSAPGTQNFAVSLVQSVVSTLVVGTTLRVVDGADETGFDLDIGAIASIGNVRLGVIARNLAESVGTRRQATLGVALVPRALGGLMRPFSVALDVDTMRIPTVYGDLRQAAVGSEQWWLKGVLASRLGLRWNTLGAAKPAVAGGLTVKLPHSLFVEGHVTKGQDDRGSDWGLGGRITF
jgi:hypothetical protein